MARRLIKKLPFLMSKKREAVQGDGVVRLMGGQMELTLVSDTKARALPLGDDLANKQAVYPVE